jgi:hypothetical protein
MSKPDITLEPSKGVVSEMAARIYAAYIIRGNMKEGEEQQYMEQSIREAVRIAKTVERSVETEDVPAASEDERTASGEAPPPRAPAASASAPAPLPRDEGPEAKAVFDTAISEALSEEDAPASKKKSRRGPRGEA